MDNFRASTLGTLNSLQSELANLQGNAERVAKLAYEARIADLNAKLEEAKATGDKDAIANAQQALRVAQEIYDLNRKKIQEEKQAQEQARASEAARKAEEAATAAQQQQQQPQPQAPQTPTNVQRIEIALPSGKTASLSGSADDVNNLMNFLNEAGLRSLQ
jgi:DNA primase